MTAPTFDRSILADLNIFLAIVRRGSMARAAVDLGVSTSALSHRLRKLEAGLGVRLLNRTSRSIRPTTAGAALAGQLEIGFQTIGDALAALERLRQFPSGRLRLNMLRDAARLVLNPVLKRYASEFPDIELDFSVEDRFVDVVADGFDAGIRYGDRVPRDMIGIALSLPPSWVVVAAPDLLKRVGRPRHPQELLARPCIRMRTGDDSGFPWEMGNGEMMLRVDVSGPLCSNETELSVDAAIRGVGFAYCLERRVTAEVAAGQLEIVLPEWSSRGAPFTIYYPSRRQPPPGLRQLIDMVRENEGLTPLLAPIAPGG